mmetsp:Transcript_43566/g.78358  ORF Transcript_43566/g.78358 Transcript_43566/m.78358 type:complete len:496 (-) Transcript_43566:379-1866(-)
MTQGGPRGIAGVLTVVVILMIFVFQSTRHPEPSLHEVHDSGPLFNGVPRVEANYVPHELERIRLEVQDRLRKDVRAFPEKVDIIVVGAGLSGAVIAERYARLLNKKVLVMDRRPHSAGNCYDYIDKATGVLVNLYGAHLFHTNYEDVWNYVQQFSGWVQYHHRVKGIVDDKIVPIPVNIDTVNTLMGKHFTSKTQMQQWLAENQVKPAGGTAINGEEAALARVGRVLYDKIFKEYTWKQWDKAPAQLAAEVLNRIPVRDDWNDRYFPEDRYQYLPAQGYTQFIDNMLKHPNIMVRLGVDYFKVRDTLPKHEKLFFTGPIDDYFAHTGWARLEYRSIIFDKEYAKPQPGKAHYQAASVVNYPQLKYGNFTRIVEYNHFPTMRPAVDNKGWGSKGEGLTQVLVKEFSTDQGEPYYPVPNKKNQDLYRKYQQMAEEESRVKGVHFVGRLASYKYFNMDQAIKNALDLFSKISGTPAMTLEPDIGPVTKPPVAISDSLN